MALEITYAEVRFKTESKSSGTNSLSPNAHKEKTTSRKRNPGFPKLLFTSSLMLLLLLAISLLVAFIIFFQKYSQVLQEKKTLLEISQKHPELECIKASSTTEGKAWSCCPKDWKSFSFHCYFFSTDSKSWNKSAESCRSMKANLLVINTKEEQDFIIQHLKIRPLYYVGLSDPEGQRHWQWIDHTPYNESATFWLQGEPSDNTERCVVLASHHNYKHNRHQWGWNDIFCDISQLSVCEMMKIYL
ncbi:C-type lectin domain family 4 member A-like [Heterocephalus glaber]|uniref:C-type lectin domain family 4 member A-like n=1 Tax=Heterocephalus glaber TaxID=10181 RepID=A0AAX6QKH2_HETGA|nr:C-type lectin domain family 4 member A-like [Heterocephalus glaber]